MQNPKTRQIWIDHAKVIAITAVIVLHVAGPATSTEFNPESNDHTVWWIANIYDSFVRFCVPLFVMITGTLLLTQKNLSLKDFFRKRLNRILLPFLFWSLVYLAFSLALKIRTEGMNAFSDIGSWLFTGALQGFWPHLWYVYMIISLYLFIPVIKPWIQAASNNAILYFLGIWVITLVLGQQKIYTIKSYLDLGYFSGYLGYLVLGYYLSERVTLSRLLRYTAVLLFLCGFTVTFAGTYLLTKNRGYFSDDFYQYLTLNVLCMSVGVYIISMGLKLNTSNKILIKAGNLIGEYGFGIYLGHELVLSALSHFHINYNLSTPWLAIPFSALLCLSLSCLLIYVLKKLPYGKYVAG